MLGLQPLLHVQAGALPTGNGRIVELGRALCARPRLILLDEPSAGLDVEETARIGQLLTAVASREGIAMLLVEHDVDLVMATCATVTVLDFGSIIATGTPDSIRANPRVQAAYLGAPSSRQDRHAPAVRSAGDSKPPLLVANAVQSGYGFIRVLHDVSLHLNTGEIVAVLGANGAGKTTLLRTLAGLLPLTGGEIWFDGTCISNMAPHAIARRGVTLVPEEQAVFGGLTVRENLDLFAAHLASDASQYKDQVFAKFPTLRERQQQQAGTLSGGEQRMLALSRAILPGVRLLMLDEISLGLAPMVVTRLFEDIAELRELGLTILLVEQYVDAALRLADRVNVLGKGHVVFSGGIEEFASIGWQATYQGKETTVAQNRMV
jgi:ABC-type branched-subunit amino acid transport system ATPase component